MISKFFNYLQDLILPSSCLICNKIISSGHLCIDHFNKLQFITNPKCKICSNPFEYSVDSNSICGLCLTSTPKYDKGVAILAYGEESKKLIFDLKYNDKIHLAKFFSKLMLPVFKEFEEIDFIIPVPLHKKRVRQRKFNHSVLIARDLSKKSKIPLIYDSLIRVKNTRPQSGLSKTGRKRNISGAIKFNDKYLDIIKGKNVVLIDDVITTASTIDACCKVLRRGGVGKIYVVTLAKTVLN